MQLPTPWLKVHGASVKAGSSELHINLPLWLLPTRRYCQVRAMTVHSGLPAIEVTHEEPFKTAVSGRNAWQSKWSHSVFVPNGQALPGRQLDRRWDRITGSPYTLERIQKTLGYPRRYEEGTEVEVLVRVTPEGFQLMLPLRNQPESLKGLGVPAMQSQLIRALASHPNHGSKSPKTYPQHSHINARCTIKETEDMKKIDNNTAADIPFGLFAGQKIVSCQFSDGGLDYAYFAGNLDLAEGDYVVVASPYGDGGACFDEESGGYLKVVRVVSVDENLEGVQKAAKWVIGKVDLVEYRERRQKVEQMRTIEARIHRAAADARKRLELDALVAVSPDLKALLAERDALASAVAPKKEEKPIIAS